MMKKLILIIIALAFFEISEAKSDSIIARKWSYEVVCAPNASYRAIAKGEDEEWLKSDRNDSEIPRFGYSIKGRFVYRLGERWSLATGINYTSIGYKIKSKELIWVVDNPDFPTELKSAHKYAYLGIPLMATYKFSTDKKWDMELVFGSSFNYFEGKNTVTSIKTNGVWSSKINKGARYDDLNVFGIVGVGTGYRLSNRWLFKTSMQFNQAIIASNTMSKTKEYLNYLDLNIGINYRIIKPKKVK
jgi:hypothetical protein